VKIIALAIFMALISSGCGVGYKFGTQSHHFVKNTNGSKILEKEHEVDISMNYHEFRLLDTTGLLMAGLVNTSRQYAARQEAVENATRDDIHDGEVEYSYKPYGIYPGTRVIADLRLNAGTPEMTIKDIDSHAGEVTYWGLDVLGEFVSFETAWIPGGKMALFFAARIDNFDYPETSDPISFNVLLVDVTFGTSLGFSPIDRLVVTGTAEIGMVGPMMKLILDDPDVSYLAGELTLEATYYPISWLGVSADATLGQLNDADRDATFGQLGIGLIAEFGGGE